jgi:CrcB protein
MLVELLIVGLGGFVGAIARYGISALVHHRLGYGFPVGTLVVNVLGCLFLGYAMTYIADSMSHRPEVSSRMQLLVCVGFLGAFTTFSTFGWETLETLRVHGMPRALASVAANVVLGLLAVLAGRGLARLGT